MFTENPPLSCPLHTLRLGILQITRKLLFLNQKYKTLTNDLPWFLIANANAAFRSVIDREKDPHGRTGVYMGGDGHAH